MAGEIAYKPSEDLYTDVPKALILSKKEYIPSYYEWLKEQGTQIVQGGTVATANDYGVYTVPVDFTLYLSTIYLDTNLATGAQAMMYLNLLTAQKFIQVNGVKAMSISYPIPIEITAKQQIILSTLGDGLVQYGITGFLVPNSVIFPVFLK